MFEEAISIQKMLSIRDMTQSKLAEVLGVSQPYIANKLRLLGFSDRERKLIAKYGLSERHARALLRIKDSNARICAIERIHEGKLNVARSEILIDCILDEEARMSISEGDKTPTERICSFERSLESALSLLREFGFRTSISRESVGERIYFSISIG